MVRTVTRKPLATLRMLATRDRDGLKAHVVREFLAGVPVEDVEAQGNAFAARVAAGWMRGDTARRLRSHQDAGHVVVLVSASLAPYLEPLGDILEVDAVLCTRLESRDGVLTGELDGPNCRGQEKVVRLARWAAEAGISGDGWLAHAYGDSAGDREMLAMAADGHDVSGMDLVA